MLGNALNISTMVLISRMDVLHMVGLYIAKHAHNCESDYSQLYLKGLLIDEPVFELQIAKLCSP